MANIKKINQLDAGQNPAPSDLLAVYNLQTGLTQKMTINQILNTIDASFKWDQNKSGGYNTGEIVTFGTPTKLYESLVDGNTEIPTDDDINWNEITSSESQQGNVSEWSAGTFTSPTLVISNLKLYYLPSSTSFPYNSQTAPENDPAWVAVIDPYSQFVSNVDAGGVIKFDKARDYGTNTSPITNTTLTEDNSGANKVIQKIYHQAPSLTLPASWVKLASSGDYVAGAVNIIFVEYESVTRKIYSITQDA